MDIVILPGDGIGPEISQATRAVLDAANQRFGLGMTFEEIEIGLKTLKEKGTTMPDGVLQRVDRSDGAILGPVSHLDYPDRSKGGINQSAAMRVGLDLYANIRPCKSRPGLGHSSKPMDLVIVREATEGFYADRNMFMGSGEFMPTPDLALAVRKVTAHGSNRIARTGFELARTRRKKVTVVHKANVLRVSDGLFLRETRKVAAEFPDIKVDEVIVDAMAAMLVRDPSRYDVIVTTNMFGDILSDEAAELSGSLGLGGAVNANEKMCVAQAQHGSAPDIAGQDKANPSSLMLSAAMLFDFLAGRHNKPAYADAAKAINVAIDAAITDPATRTADLGGGKLGCAAFGKLIAEAVKKAK